MSCVNVQHDKRNCRDAGLEFRNWCGNCQTELERFSRVPFTAAELMIQQIMREDGLSRREAVMELVREGQIHPDEAEGFGS